MREAVFKYGHPISDMYHAHKLAWDIMSNGRDNVPRDFQFRFHSLDGMTLFHIRGGAFELPNAQEATTRFHLGCALEFNLMVAPILRVNDATTGKRREIPIEDKMGAIGWLSCRALNGGFDLKRVDAAYLGNTRCTKGDKKFNVAQWRFTGKLVVTDAAAFQKTMECGIGRYRAFGQGMLVVKGIENEC